MKNIRLLFSALTISLLLSGCAAYHQGSMTGSAALSQANFSYVKQNVSAKSSAVYVFGIGGIDKKTLVDDAKKKLIAANPMGPNQAMANVTVNFKKSWYMGIIYQTVDCVISADIVEFR